MRFRRFGKTDWIVSELGFGCARLAGTATEAKDPPEVLRTLREAISAGVNIFDTADIYGNGGSEQILGKAIRGRRTEVFVCSKAGYSLRSAGRIAASLKAVARPVLQHFSSRRAAARALRASELHQDFSPHHLTTAIDRSLTRLRTDYIDLFQLHNPPLSVITSGMFIEPLERSKAAGKIRCYGIACRTAEDGRACLRHSSIAAIQIPVNVLRLVEAETIAVEAHEYGVAVIAREVLSTVRPPTSDCAGDGSSRPEPPDPAALLRAALDAVGFSVVLVGMSSVAHLCENLRVGEFGHSSSTGGH